MIRYLHIHPKVEKLLQKKNRTSARGIAARRASRIIESLRSGVCVTVAGPLSHTKEVRVKRTFKYDLGKGFRLITVKKKSDLYVLFLGDHDQCDRWLDTYSKKKPGNTDIELNSYPVGEPFGREGSAPDCTAAGEPANEFAGESENRGAEDWEHRLTQKQLRKVFCGLVRKHA